MSGKILSPAARASLLILAAFLAGCQAASQDTAPDGAKVAKALAQASLTGSGAFEVKGKEYIIKLEGKGGGQADAMNLVIPAIPGAMDDGLIEGVNEYSLSLETAMPLKDLMEYFTARFSERKYSPQNFIMDEGMSSASWISPDGGFVRVYAMEEKGKVRARVVASLSPDKQGL